MTDMGLKEEELTMIRLVLQKHEKVEQAVIFGSRAKGNSRANSDIDLAVFGDLDGIDAERIILDLEDMPMIQKFDVVSVRDVKNNALKEHIERTGVKVYER